MVTSALDTLIRGKRLLVLSPHLDDAMFSLASVAQRYESEVWTVFAGEPEAGVRTEWDERCGFDSGRELIRARRAEDQAAFTGSKAKIRHLDALERAYADAERRAHDMKQLLDDLDAWLAAVDTPAVVFLPAGAGVIMEQSWLVSSGGARARQGDATIKTQSVRHRRRRGAGLLALGISAAKKLKHRLYMRYRRQQQQRGMLANEDHLELRDVVADHLVGHPSVSVCLYEELPYLWSQRGDQQASVLAHRHNCVAERVVLHPDRVDKHRRITAYVTQATLMDPVARRLESPETLPAEEVVWIVSQP